MSVYTQRVCSQVREQPQELTWHLKKLMLAFTQELMLVFKQALTLAFKQGVMLALKR